MFFHDKPLEKEDFLKLLPKSQIGAEIGVFKGDVTKTLLETADPLRFHLMDDSWMLSGQSYADHGDNAESGNLKTADEFVALFNCMDAIEERCVIHFGEYLTVLETFVPYYFDWVYLHTGRGDRQIRPELDLLSAKVKPTGLITGNFWHRTETADAISEFCMDSNWKIVYVDEWNQWCLMNIGN